MKNVAIIPARGGSIRIPRKNIRQFCGKPIIAYSIEIAIESGLFDKVIVSTDDKEIASIAEEYGAEVPFMRPPELADAYTGTNDVISHAVKELKLLGYVYDYVCCIYATAPLLDCFYITEGIEKLSKAETKRFAFGVSKFDYPVQRSFTIDDNDSIAMLQPETLNTRSQDLPDVYHDAGQFYWADTEAYLSGKVNFFSSLSIPVELPKYLVQDIDDEDDWKRAELMHQALQPSTDIKC